MALVHTAVSLVLVFLVLAARAEDAQKEKRCQTPAIAPHRVEKVISDCQDEIKLAILQEALEELEQSTAVLASRVKRDLFTEDERLIAGCLLQCVYRKVRAVDATGFPTREGLTRLYAEGVQERGYYLATARASQQCLQTAHQRRLVGKPSGKQACNLAYDTFECISNKISEYCNGTD